MAMFNRRNALLGWAVWQIASKSAKAKARRHGRRAETGDQHPKRHLVRKVLAASAVVTGVAAVVAARTLRRPPAEGVGP
jgi:hypothetical protein